VKALDEQSAALAAARQEVADGETKYAALLKSQTPVDPKVIEESAKALEGLRTKVRELEGKLAATTASLAEAKAKVDATLPAAHALRAKAEDLKARYLALRATK
jgi:hypothetical protein